MSLSTDSVGAHGLLLQDHPLERGSRGWGQGSLDGFLGGELDSCEALLSCRAAFLFYRQEPQINGNSLWHHVGALRKAGSEVLCHFGLRNCVFPREGE